MPLNPENVGDIADSTEKQQIIESAKAEVDSLGEEVATTAGTKSELNKGFAEFFKRLKDVWDEFKQGHISKAIAILFGNTNEEATNKENTNKDNNNKTTQQETSTKPTDSTVTTTNENGSTETGGTPTTNTGEETKEKEPASKEIVNIKKYISDIKYDLKYASSDNSFGKIIYPDGESNLKLEYDAVKKLSIAQEILKEQGFQLKIWDAYRPDEAQKLMRENYKGPKETKTSNVAIPKGITYNGKKGTGSNHGTGTAVDLTIVDSNGNEIEMPTDFDDFSGNAKWNKISGKNGQKYKNAYILRRAMEKAGFYTIGSERRHYQTNVGRSTLNHLKTDELRQRGISF